MMQINWLPDHYVQYEDPIPYRLPREIPSVALSEGLGAIAGWTEGERLVPKHLNVYTGLPCECTFFVPPPMTKTASKLEWLEKRPDFQTPEKAPLLNHFRSVIERAPQADALLPWLAREVKKKRLHLIHNPPQSEIEDAIAKNDSHRIYDLAEKRKYAELYPYAPLAATTENPDPDFGMRYKPVDNHLLSHMGDWYADKKAPNRQGLDIMQHHWNEIENQKLPEWEDWIDAESLKADAKGAEEAPIAHDYGNGWTLRQLRPEDLEYEGNAMGHCVGGYGYGEGVRNGNKMIYSLRDPKQKPHVTMELEPTMCEGPHGELSEERIDGGPLATPKQARIVQIQGQGNKIPKPEYQAMMKQYMETMKPEERPYWGDEDAIAYPADLFRDHQIDADPQFGGYGSHGDYGVENKNEVYWPDVLYNSVANGHPYSEDADPEHLYLAALKRKEIPELADALEGFGNEQNDNYQDWLDQNYGYFLQDPEITEDGEYPLVNPNWPDPVENREQHERAYNEEQNQLVEEHPGMNLTNTLYQYLHPHLQRSAQGRWDYTNQIQPDPTDYVRREMSVPNWFTHPAQQMWERGELEEMPSQATV